MLQVAVRRARQGDAPAIADLTTELGYGASVAEIADRLAALTQRSSSFIAVAERHGCIVGWVAAEQRVLLESGPRVEIVGLVVAATERRAGVGRALVAAVEQWQANRGIATVFVRSNVVRNESHPFYERLGYTRRKTQHVYVKTAAAQKGSR